MIAAAVLILLHAPGGADIFINPQLITSLRPHVEGQSHFTDEAECMISLADGKFVTVVEHCDTVRKMIEDTK